MAGAIDADWRVVVDVRWGLDWNGRGGWVGWLVWDASSS